MNILNTIAGVFSGGNPVKEIASGLDNLFTSDKEKLELKNELEKAKMDFELENKKLDTSLLHDQAEINKIEAASANWFVAGWRPAVGWVCTIGLAYQFIIQPLLCWIDGIAYTNFSFKTVIATPPTLDARTIIELLVGMLGLGSMRTLEKVKEVDTKNLNK